MYVKAIYFSVQCYLYVVKICQQKAQFKSALNCAPVNQNYPHCGR